MKITMKPKPLPRLEKLYPFIADELKNEGYLLKTMKINSKPIEMKLACESKTMNLFSSCIMPIVLLVLWVAIVLAILIPS